MTSFWRTIEIVIHGSTEDGVAKVALEDDYHHFQVCLRLCNQKVTATCARALRTPYTLCANASAQLSKLEYVPVINTAAAIHRHTDARLQCTHQLDMAGLALAAAARGDTRLRYFMEVPRHQQGQTHPRLWRNDKLIVEWSVLNNTLCSPFPYEGVHLGKGFSHWAIKNLDAYTAEAVIVLRRSAIIALGRLRDLDLETHAAKLGHCYAQQPERATEALRVLGSTKDFSSDPYSLCSTDRDWLRDDAFTTADNSDGLHQ
ncbi:hypothetical protein HBA55_31195 [Pseudomaricurvus alkylphenolicus]|uniref:hypothetical protein n=1 Tax=Pseudomaricurvus alkylphenolicus TaxID=1306991 RepID=UPI0014227DDC|nr:hypothetical protein [Pseudomaricurvus alkylphenolicus]NIB44108.1 hypothetical protein [Pseudomaricurvus alkylphenolicus]